MRLSELQENEIYSFLNLDEPTDEKKRDVEIAKAAAIAFVSSYTGLKEDEIDEFEDITQAVLIITSDFYDNRNLTSVTNYKNPMVESILSLHSTNLI